MIKVTRRLTAAAVGLAMLGASGLANAAPPGWSRSSRVLQDTDISTCGDAAQAVLQFLTRNAQRFNHSSRAIEVRAFNTDAGVFAYCTPTPRFCDVRLTVVSFSSKGAGDASAARELVDDTIGNPGGDACRPIP